MHFRPCIDLHGGKVKQIVGSTLCDTDTGVLHTNFETEQPASFFASRYRVDGLWGGHLIMLGKGNEAAALDAIRAFPGGFQVGGGITPDTARPFLDQGASHVIVTSFVFSGGAVQWERLGLLEKTVGKRRLTLDLSCRNIDGRYVIACDRWQRLSGVGITRELFERLAVHCDEFLVHAVDVEGKRAGIDSELVKFLADASPIPATYAGGVRSLEDLEDVRVSGRSRIDATVGSALDIFGGSLDYKAVVAWHRRHNKQTE